VRPSACEKERPRPRRFGSSWQRARRYRCGRSVWVFLAPAVLALKACPKWVGLSWISLDSLVRIETYQLVTRHKVGKLFSRAFSPLVERRRNGSLRSRPCGSAGLFMGQAYPSSDFLQKIIGDFCRSGELCFSGVRPKKMIRRCLPSFEIIWPAASGACATGPFPTACSATRR
jgi:hypothetical protein